MSGTTPRERLLETYERIYYFEHDRQERLVSRVPILLAVYSILLSVLASSADSLPGRGNSFAVWCLRCGFLLEAVTLIVSGWYTGRFLWFGHTYGYLIPNGAVRGEPDDPAEETQTAEATDAEILRIYAETAASNYRNNQDRIAYITSAMRWLIIGSGIALATAVPYFLIRTEHRADAQKVEIVNFRRSDTMEQAKMDRKPEPGKPEGGDAANEAPEPGRKISGTGLGAVYVRPGDTVEKSKKRGDWKLRR